jgi:hypothetical protein
MKSHDPRSTNPSISRVTSARVPSSHGATAAGVKYWLIRRLNVRCSGGSMPTGRIFIAPAAVDPGPARTTGTVMPSSLLNARQSWATRSTSS